MHHINLSQTCGWGCAANCSVNVISVWKVVVIMSQGFWHSLKVRLAFKATLSGCWDSGCVIESGRRPCENTWLSIAINASFWCSLLLTLVAIFYDLFYSNLVDIRKSMGSCKFLVVGWKSIIHNVNV